jgi:L-iditol 2-dehydrogenase
MFFNGPTKRYQLPIVLGHEFVAEVLELGEGVRDFAIGDRVGVNSVIPCLSCPPCASGKDNICDNEQLFGVHVPGGFAEYLWVPARMVHAGGVSKIPTGVSDEAASLTEVLGCCLHGLGEVGGVNSDDQVLVIGDGAVGLTFLQIARLRGAARIVTSGRRPKRRELAMALGADTALDAKATTPTEYVAMSDFRPNLVIVAAATVEATREGLDIVRPGGRVLIFSGYLPGTTVPLDVNAVHYRELRIAGSIDCTARDFRMAAGLLPRLRMGDLVSHTYPFEQAVEAFRATREPDAVRVLVDMRRAS